MNQQSDNRRILPWWAWLLLLLLLVLIVLWWLRHRTSPEAAPADEAALGRRLPEAQPAPALGAGDVKAGPAVAEMERDPTANDLTEIEGIGPRLSAILQAAGITTFSQLAQTTPENIRAILRAAGHNIADPTSWPEQARLLAAGDWEGFKALTSRLKGGRYRD